MESLNKATTEVKHLISRTSSVVLEAALLITPLAILLAGSIAWPVLLKPRRKKFLWIGVILYVAYFVTFHDNLHAYQGIALYDAGLGFPPNIAALQAFHSPKLTETLNVFHLATLLISAVSLGCIGLFLASHAGSLLAKIKSQWNDPQHVMLIVIAMSCSLNLLLMLPMLRVFDRYVIPVAALALVGLSMVDRRPPSKAWSIAGCTALVGTIIFCVVGTQDALKTKQEFWDAVDWLHAQGVDPMDIEGGWAHYGTFIYEPGYRNRDTAGKTFVEGHNPGKEIITRPLRWRIGFQAPRRFEVYKRFPPYTTWMRPREEVIIMLRPPRKKSSRSTPPQG